MKRKHTILLTTIAVALVGAAGCSSTPNTGVAGSSVDTTPNVPGTVFTIVFENDDGVNVMQNANPTFMKLAAEYGEAKAYVSATHPSLPNYIQMTSGATQGANNDSDPPGNVQVPGTDNLADQLDAKGVPWRAYMESMGDPCKMLSSGDYSAHHDPFLYYSTMANDPARCAQDVVDYDANFATDLASGKYRYMWITPNMCNDLHNCSSQVADAWLDKTTQLIMASDAYKNGGAIFVLFDEGSQRILGAAADLATIVISPNLVHPNYVTYTAFDHRSYLASVEDIFGLPRLSTTSAATSMDEFFKTKGAGADGGVP